MHSKLLSTLRQDWVVGQSDILIRDHVSDGIVTVTRDALDVAALVNGLAVFIPTQIGLEINWFAANFAGCFWERVTTHKRLLWTVTSSVS
jgi:hypothetical protein